MQFVFSYDTYYKWVMAKIKLSIHKSNFKDEILCSLGKWPKFGSKGRSGSVVVRIAN